MLKFVPTPATKRQVLIISAYFSFLLVGAGMHTPSGLFSLPIQFYFKNKLHLSAQMVSYFGLVTAIPLYVGFFVGFLRDAWRLRKMGDRGYLLLGGVALTFTYLGMALVPPGWTPLLVGTILLAIAYLIVSAATAAMTTQVGQERLMTGRLSAISNLMGTVPVIISYAVGGRLSDNWSLRSVFLLMATLSLTLWIQAFWHSKDIFVDDTMDDTVLSDEPKTRFNLCALLQHRGALLATLIWMVWNFAPGANTATLYYLTNTVKLTDAEYGQYMAVFAVAFCPIYACYGFLCRRFTLRALLFWGTIVAIPQLVPILWIHSGTTAMIVAALMGIMGGVATAAYYDLLIRACPKGLEGTVMMISVTGYWVFGKWGDLLGSWLYERGGYLPCVIATTLAYASILLLLSLIPRAITQDTEEQSGNREREYAGESGAEF